MGCLALASTAVTGSVPESATEHSNERPQQRSDKIRSDVSRHVRIFLGGDIMTGRGIDQILPHPGNPQIYERYVKSAMRYVELGESANGPISKPVGFSYIWGEALAELDVLEPDLRLVNLETSVTTSDDWALKGVNYKMHPRNIPCLTTAGIDCCTLANNHVLDWGPTGLVETLATLDEAGIKSTGAGRTRAEAEAPAVIDVCGKGRVLVFSFGVGSSGIPRDWSASDDQPGVNRLSDLSEETVRAIAETIRVLKQPKDIVVASLHWGPNWGYEIPKDEITFAHRLIDVGGVDVVHGHSSHHVKAIEVYEGKLILYGCGDFLNDYEGIAGYEEFRSDLSLMYFLTIDPTAGTLVGLIMTPLQIKNFRLYRARDNDVRWLRDLLNREGGTFGTSATLVEASRLALAWA